VSVCGDKIIDKKEWYHYNYKNPKWVDDQMVMYYSLDVEQKKVDMKKIARPDMAPQKF
jgi:hypothetical protein